MKALMLLMKVMAVLPVIIKAVQQMVPENAGNGPSKLKAALDILAVTVGDVSEVLPMVTTIIETLVALGKGTMPGAAPVTHDDNVLMN